MLVLMWDLGGGSQHGRGRVLRAEEVEVDVGEADVVPHLEDARLHIEDDYPFKYFCHIPRTALLGRRVSFQRIGASEELPSCSVLPPWLPLLLGLPQSGS